MYELVLVVGVFAILLIIKEAKRLDSVRREERKEDREERRQERELRREELRYQKSLKKNEEEE